MATNPKKEKLAALKVEQLKPKAKRLGVKLTNPSGNAKTKAQLITAIIKAEDKKPAAKKPAAKRSAVKKGLAPVVGASKRRDAERQALPPGRRVSKGGKVYYERRSNRADAKQNATKGQMLGIEYDARNYIFGELSLLNWDGEYRCSVKFNSDAGSTRYISLSNETIPFIIEYLEGILEDQPKSIQ
jgi:hypothetical protein